MKVIGKIHNARVCTIDDRDCYIASILLESTGKLIPGSGSGENVHESSTLADAEAWLLREARRRDLMMRIAYERTGVSAIEARVLNDHLKATMNAAWMGEVKVLIDECQDAMITIERERKRE